MKKLPALFAPGAVNFACGAGNNQSVTDYASLADPMTGRGAVGYTLK